MENLNCCLEMRELCLRMKIRSGWFKSIKPSSDSSALCEATLAFLLALAHSTVSWPPKIVILVVDHQNNVEQCSKQRESTL